MTDSGPIGQTVSDSEHHGLMALLPASMRPYASLARFDRPIGWWLLYWPCFWGLALAGGLPKRWDLALWMLLGAIAMRGAGCVYNDIVDRDLDASVERTRNRPLPSGTVSVKAAWIWLLSLTLIGLIVLLQLPRQAQIIALGSIILVAAYPFMKRITWWPQAWLGMVFSWGALVGGAAGANDWPPPAIIWLYAGTIFWVIGYDTIYALQDVEDDALAGIKSSARRMGEYVRMGVGTCYGLALFLWSIAIWLTRGEVIALVALLPMALHLFWQVVKIDPADPANPLRLFRSNRNAGLLMALACLVVGMTR